MSKCVFSADARPTRDGCTSLLTGVNTVTLDVLHLVSTSKSEYFEAGICITRKWRLLPTGNYVITDFGHEV